MFVQSANTVSNAHVDEGEGPADKPRLEQGLRRVHLLTEPLCALGVLGGKKSVLISVQKSTPFYAKQTQFSSDPSPSRVAQTPHPSWCRAQFDPAIRDTQYAIRTQSAVKKTQHARHASTSQRPATRDERRLYTISFSNSKAPKSSKEFSQNPLFFAFFCLFTAIFRRFFQFFSNFRTFRRTRKPAPFAPLDPEFPLPTHSPTPLFALF